MKYKKTLFGSILLLSFLYFLNSCGIYRPVSAKEYPPAPAKRVAKNIEEGRGFRLMGGDKKGGTFDFASSNELWRASLDLSLIHISEPTRLRRISYAVFCLKKKISQFEGYSFHHFFF